MFSYYDELCMVIHPIVEILRVIWPSPQYVLTVTHKHTHTHESRWLLDVSTSDPSACFTGPWILLQVISRTSRWMVQWKQYRTKFSPLPQVKDLVEEKTYKLADAKDFCALEIRFFFAQVLLFFMTISLIGRADLLSLGAETIGYKQTCSMVPSMYSIVFKYTYYVYVDCNTRTLKKNIYSSLENQFPSLVIFPVLPRPPLSGASSSAAMIWYCRLPLSSVKPLVFFDPTNDLGSKNPMDRSHQALIKTNRPSW